MNLAFCLFSPIFTHIYPSSPILPKTLYANKAIFLGPAARCAAATLRGSLSLGPYGSGGKAATAPHR
jgi:hypothetical protein